MHALPTPACISDKSSENRSKLGMGAVDGSYNGQLRHAGGSQLILRASLESLFLNARGILGRPRISIGNSFRETLYFTQNPNELTYPYGTIRSTL